MTITIIKHNDTKQNDKQNYTQIWDIQDNNFMVMCKNAIVGMLAEIAALS
jgi:hypothetical protein